MIPGAFAYHRPTSVKEAVGLLAQLGDDGRALAGGHSLIPMMKLRLATPANLVDLAAIAELKGVRADGNDIVIGAMTTQHELIGSDLLAAKSRSCARPRLQIADPQVRYLGTLGGNVANGDPGNDMPAVMMCLTPPITSWAKGERDRGASVLPGRYFTALKPGEVLTAIRIPVPPPDTATRTKNSNANRRLCDCGGRCCLTMAGGKVGTCSIGLTNVAETPLWAEEAAKILIGSALDAATVKKAAAAAEAIAAPANDGRGPAHYRTKMAGVMVPRALVRAKSRARG